MKHNFFFLLLILIGLSCHKKTSKSTTWDEMYKSDAPNTYVSGILSNPVSNYIVIKNAEFTDTILLDQHNGFNTSLYLKNPDYFILSDGKANLRLFLNPGYNLKLSYNSKNAFKTIVFEGNGAEANSYMRDKYLLMLDHALPLDHLFAMPVDNFKHIVDSLYVIDKLYLDEFLTKNTDIPELFKTTEMVSITYNRASSLLDYLNASPNQHNIDTGRYLSFINKLTLNNSAWIGIYEYRSFLNSYITYYASLRYKNKNMASHEKTLSKMQTVVAKIKNQEVKDLLLFSILREQVKYYGYKNTDLLFDTFEYQCQNTEMKEGLLIPYQHYKKLQQKEKAPDILMTDLNGNKLKLNDFKGKYVYIDVWATWCLPCKKETPIFEALREKFKHKNVEFISISIDSKKEDWQEYLMLKKLSHNQFIVKEIKPFVDDYMINTVPHFMIIDDKGNLMDNDAPRPSEGKTEWLENLPDKKPV